MPETRGESHLSASRAGSTRAGENINAAQHGFSQTPRANDQVARRLAVPIFAVLSSPPSIGGFGSEPWSSILNTSSTIPERDRKRPMRKTSRCLIAGWPVPSGKKDNLKPIPLALSLGTMAVSSIAVGLPVMAFRKRICKDRLRLECLTTQRIDAGPGTPEEDDSASMGNESDVREHTSRAFRSATVFHDSIRLELPPWTKPGPPIERNSEQQNDIELPPGDPSCGFRCATVTRKAAELRVQSSFSKTGCDSRHLMADIKSCCESECTHANKEPVIKQHLLAVDLDMSSRSSDLSDIITPSGDPPKRPEQSQSPEGGRGKTERSYIQELEIYVDDLKKEAELMEEELQALGRRAADLQAEVDLEKEGRRAGERWAAQEAVRLEMLQVELTAARNREEKLQNLWSACAEAAEAAMARVCNAENENHKLLEILEEEHICQAELSSVSESAADAAVQYHKAAAMSLRGQVEYLEGKMYAAKQQQEEREALVAELSAREAQTLGQAAMARRNAEQDRIKLEAEVAAEQERACIAVCEANGLRKTLGREREAAKLQAQKARALEAALLDEASRARCTVALLREQLQGCGEQLAVAAELLESSEAVQGEIIASMEMIHLQELEQREEVQRAAATAHAEAEAALRAEIHDLEGDLKHLQEQEENLQDMLASKAAREWEHQARISVLEVEAESLAEQRDICESEARSAVIAAEDAEQRAGNAEQRLAGLEPELELKVAEIVQLQEALNCNTGRRKGMALVRTSCQDFSNSKRVAPSMPTRPPQTPCTPQPNRSATASPVSVRDPFDEFCMPVTELGSMAATLFAMDSSKSEMRAREDAAANLVQQLASRDETLFELLKSLGGQQVLLRAADPGEGTDSAAAKSSVSSPSDRLRLLAIQGLGHIAASPEMCYDLVCQGAIPVLCRALGDHFVSSSSRLPKFAAVSERLAAASVFRAMAAHPWCWRRMANEGAVRCLVSALDPSRAEEAQVVRACAIACSLLACDERALGAMQRAGGRWLLGATIRSRWVGKTARQAAACALERLEKTDKKSLVAKSADLSRGV